MKEYQDMEFGVPILEQLPEGYRSAALLLHPFIQMPDGWKQTKKRWWRPRKHIYPTDTEKLEEGKPVAWKDIMRRSGLNSHEKIGIALDCSDHSSEHDVSYAKERLQSALEEDTFEPENMTMCVLTANKVLNFLKKRGTGHIHLSEPQEGEEETIELNTLSPEDLMYWAPAEWMMADDDGQFIFWSDYDSSVTLFMAAEADIRPLVKELDCEAIICDSRTQLNWDIPKYL